MIITLNRNLTLNSCSLIFNREGILIGLTSGCIQIMNIDAKYLDLEKGYEDIFYLDIEELEKKTSFTNKN